MYISKKQLAGFSTYKYNCIDTSPLSNYIFHPFWNQVVKLVPLWLAANILTFTGFLLLVVQFIVMCCYDPDYKSAEHDLIPSWVWWFSAFCHFTSHTLDGIDGKQARRTNTSSPLGELFDHGLDSWSSSLITMNVLCIFKQEAFGFVPGGYISILCLTSFAIITPHWEKYNTGVLYLPWSLDLSLTVITICYVITAMFGTLFWETKIFGISLTMYIAMVVCVSTIPIGIPLTIYNIISANLNQNGRGLSFIEGMRPLISPFILFVVMFIIRYLVDGNDRILLFLTGVVFSNIMCRLIICQMTKTKCETFNKLILILISYLVLICLTNTKNIKFYILVGTTVVTTLAHIHYGVVVVRGLAKHFDIWVFTPGKRNSNTNGIKTSKNNKN